MSSRAFVAALQDAIKGAAGEVAALEPHQLEQLATHWELLQRWNPRTNLTAITEPSEAATLHYLDSLHVIPFLATGDVLDIGSGAGFPGVPIAVATGRPTTLMEPRRKRASFLRTAKAQLGLPNLTILEGRSGDPPSHTFANVVTRATFSDPGDLAACQRWVAPGGRLVAMRGPDGEALAQFETHPYVLGTVGRRLAVWSAPGLSGQ